MKTHKNNFPGLQQIKTFFQSFFKKPIFVLKKIISLQVIEKSSVFAIFLVAGKLGTFSVTRDKLIDARSSAGLLFGYMGFLIPQQRIM